MKFSIRYSSIKEMLKLCKKLKSETVKKSEIERILNHKDYQFEFLRYEDRISKEEFIYYFLNIPNLLKDDMKNKDLKIHHKYYKDLLDNLNFYEKKLSELKKLTPDLFKRQISTALKGLPNDIIFPDLSFIFTIGIGQSFGYIYGNGMHFDYLQLAKEMKFEDFCAVISHEVHHVGTNLIYEKINLNSIPLEALFYLYFSGEGLAVKYCNNAEGVLSKSIYSGPKNIGLDNFTWKYLNNDFYNAMEEFKNTISDIRSSRINSIDELEKHIMVYWMNSYTDDQNKGEIPKLKHSRLYSFGNDIWGIIHDCFGKDMVYKTLKNPMKFPHVFNKALEQLGHEEFKI